MPASTIAPGSAFGRAPRSCPWPGSDTAPAHITCIRRRSRPCRFQACQFESSIKMPVMGGRLLLALTLLGTPAREPQLALELRVFNGGEDVTAQTRVAV